MKFKVLIILGLLCLFYIIIPAFAADPIDPSIFIEPASGGTLEDTSGWYAGWVVTTSFSGTYNLHIYATGGENSGHWPISSVYIVVAISKEAYSGGLVSLKINGVPIVGFTAGPCSKLPTGGPFAEPDYYGYNDIYQIPGGLTLSEGARDHPKTFTVEIVFSPSATEASKLAFLSYGTDAKGYPAKTPFTGQIMCKIPELTTLILTSASMVALGAYKIKRKHRYIY